jgi:ATP-dependent Clp protease ATP-binding subunit ClpC
MATQFAFSAGVRQALAAAREQAVRAGQEGIGPEHLLLGLLRDREGRVSTLLRGLGFRVTELEDRVQGTLLRNGRGAAPLPVLPYHEHARRALDLAVAEARHLDAAEVEPEHVLLALLELDSPVAALLAAEGLTPARAREVLPALGDGMGG